MARRRPRAERRACAPPADRVAHLAGPPTTVDLRETALTGIHLDGDQPALMRLPPGALSCQLTTGPMRPGGPPEVDAVDAGRRLHLTVSSPEPVIPAGLEGVRRVTLDVAGSFTARSLLGAGDVEHVTIRWGKPPGALLEADLLARLPRLHTIELLDAYGLDLPALPDPAAWPALRRLRIHGLRGSDASALRGLFRRGSVWLDLRGAKSDTWLKANLANPFRDWVDDDERAGSMACTAYAKASRAMDSFAGGPDEAAAAARDVLRALIERLNAVEANYGFIDTLRREEAVDAAVALAARAGASADRAADWIDEWRDF
jgi:hypothetical protein